jgi:two-component system, chemotaxis family, protein-glutamate methylesterase/glutaminase
MTGKIKIIVIGGSAGSFNVVRKILLSLPADFPVPIVLCLHRLKDVKKGFVESLNLNSKLKVKEPEDKDPVKPGYVYLSPPNYHLLIEPTHNFALSTEDNINFSRPSIDITFDSAGYSFRDKMAGIILSGANGDGARGLYHAHINGAFTVVQDPKDAQFNIMPGETLKLFTPDKILKEDEIVEFIKSLRINAYV